MRTWSRPTAVIVAVLAAVFACSAEKKRTDPEPDPEPSLEPSPEPVSPTPAPKPRTWSFDTDPVATVPAGISIGETNPHNHPATWAVVATDDAPVGPHAFGVTACDNPKAAVFEVALIDDTHYGDFEAEVWLKAVEGEHDQGGGLVWRAQDHDNYYVTRWNPVEGNLRFYVIRDSARKKLAEMDVALEAGTWHRLHLTVVGSHFEVSLNDLDALTVDDQSFTEPGKIGFWTKSDAKTLFDELVVTESPSLR